MNLIKDFKSVDDPNNLGSAPLSVRITIMAMIFAGVLGGAYYLDIQALQEQLASERIKEPDLKNKIVEKQQLAANLDAYKAQLLEMEQTLQAILRQLPNKKEIENLIVDVAQTSLADGLKNVQIQALPEVPYDYYAEAPYVLRFQGTYHQLAKFVSDASALPRIITLHNFATITPSADFARNKVLDLNITAKTYRYLDAEEIKQRGASATAATRS
ncbi:MAG: type 4a pilus biogenesis protein PilO [Pseudomonadota bacterium]